METKINSQKSVCLFDMDGTLVDSMPYWSRSVLKLLEDRNIPYDPSLIRTFTALGYIGTARYYRQHFGLSESVDALVQEMKDNAFYEYSHNVRTKPGVTAYLQKLRASGVRCAVLTASPHSITDICLKHNGIYDLFEKVWSADDFAMSKNDPEIYRLAAEALGCQIRDIRFFDDNLLALQAGKQAGLALTAVYDPFSEPDMEAIRSLSESFVMSFESLL